MSRKRIYETEEERKEAHKQAALKWARNNKKENKNKPSKKRNKSPEPKKDKAPQTDKAVYIRLDKLENEVEKLKWEIFGRKI